MIDRIDRVFVEVWPALLITLIIMFVWGFFFTDPSGRRKGKK